MKILKYLVILIVVLVLIFIGKGLLTPFIEYECKIQVNKSAKEAWAVMSDEENLPKWLKGYQKSELISGTENTVGAVSKIYFLDQGQEMVIQETITNIKPNELITMDFDMDFMKMKYEMRFDEADGKTTISSKTKTFGNGIIAKSLVSFMKSTMQSQEEENMNNLQKLIENNTKNYFPEPETEMESVQ